jgi:hypothetical protein
MEKEGARANIHFAKAYGVDGRYDYIYVTNTESDNGDITYDFNVWRNDGAGGTMVKGDYAIFLSRRLLILIRLI